MIVKTTGIVIRTVKYGESSIIFDVYTREYGVCSFIVGGVRRKNSRLSPAIFQLMSWVEIVAYLKSPKHLNRVKEARTAYLYQSMPFDVAKRSVCLFITEIIQKSIHEHEANIPLFDFISSTFNFVDGTDQPILNLHVVFLVQFSKFLGFMPRGTWSEDYPYLDLLKGTFVDMPHPLYTLDKLSSQWLSSCLPCSIESSQNLVFSRSIRQKLVDDLLSFYRLHLEKLPEIHTHKILADVFT
ncbi:MAG: DNA repair protein RecO [Saprospiraceae bacterium]|nr:DNA repair protein RecO [Saprospiraceae bacterium]